MMKFKNVEFSQKTVFIQNNSLQANFNEIHFYLNHC